VSETKISHANGGGDFGGVIVAFARTFFQKKLKD